MDWSQPGLIPREIFDAVVTDPPYGLKARSKKTAKSEQESDEPRIMNFCPFGVEETGIFSKKEDYEYQRVYYDLPKPQNPSSILPISK